MILDPEKIIISSGSPLNFWKTCQDSKKMTWIPSELGCLWINLLTNAMGGFHYFKKSMLSSGPDRTSITPLIYSFLTNGAKSQIREQMSGPEISWYGKSILGCGLDRGKKGSGPILSNFFGVFFSIFNGQKRPDWKVA